MQVSFLKFSSKSSFQLTLIHENHFYFLSIACTPFPDLLLGDSVFTEINDTIIDQDILVDSMKSDGPGVVVIFKAARSNVFVCEYQYLVNHYYPDNVKRNKNKLRWKMYYRMYKHNSHELQSQKTSSNILNINWFIK